MNKGIITSFVLLIAAILYFLISSPEKVKVNNLLIITIDTVRADTFYAPDDNNYPDRLSPWLKQARVYRQAQSVSPWTIPAIATVLTGYAPNQHGAGAFQQNIANLDAELPSSVLPEVATITEHLVKLGFTTNAISAHPWFFSNFGLQRGFDKINKRKKREDIDSWFAKSLHNRKLMQAAADAKAKAEARMETRVRTQKRIDTTQRNFTYIHYMEAHGRHTDKVNEYFIKLSTAEITRNLTWTDLSACRAGVIAGMCRRYLVYTQAVLDLRDSLANTLEQLDKSGLLEETLVLVYSDHGEEFHDHLSQALADNHDPREVRGFGHGNSLYEEQLHIPLLIWHPNDSKGRVITTPVSLLDVVPSILDWLGVDISTDDFPGMLLDKAEKTKGRVLYASNIAYGPEQISVRDGNLKSIWNTVTDRSRYFDLQKDPDEQNPLTGDDLVLHFDTLTGDYLELASTKIGETPEIDAEQLERLKSIGYLQGNDSATKEPKPTPNTNLATKQAQTEASQRPQTETKQ